MREYLFNGGMAFHSEKSMRDNDLKFYARSLANQKLVKHCFTASVMQRVAESATPSQMQPVPAI